MVDIIAEITENNIETSIVENNISVEQNVNEINSIIIENNVTVEITTNQISVTIEAIGWDMFKSIYDPQNKFSDAFNMENMNEWATNKIFSVSERSKLAWIEAGAEKNVWEEYTTVEKNKLAWIENWAEANNLTDQQAIALLNDKHTHSNKSTLDQIEVALTTAYKTQLDQEIKVVQLETPRNIDFSSLYSEYTETSWKITQIDYWKTSAKTTKLFTKVLTYTGEDLTSVVMTDEITSNTMTTTLVWTAGVLQSVTKVLS